MKDYLAIAGSIVFFLSFLPYIKDIIRGKTRPNLVTWFTWTLITAINTWVAFSEHEYSTGFFTLGATVATAIIVILAFKKGVKKYTKFDVICQIIAIAGIVMWQVTGDAAIAILFVLSADFTAALPTIRHAMRRPHQETWQTFALGIIGEVLTMGSLKQYNIVALGYPLYAFVLDSFFTVLILFERLRKRQKD